MNDHLRQTVAGQSIQHLVCNRAFSSRFPPRLPDAAAHDRPTPVYDDFARPTIIADTEITEATYIPSFHGYELAEADGEPQTASWSEPPLAIDADTTVRAAPLAIRALTKRALLAATLLALLPLLLSLWHRIAL